MKKEHLGIRTGWYLKPITMKMLDKLVEIGSLSDDSLVTSRRTVLEGLLANEFRKQGLSIKELEQEDNQD